MEDYTFYISAPAKGKYPIGKAGFEKCWVSTKDKGKEAGFALLLTPTPEFHERIDDHEQQKKNLSFYLRYLFPYRSQLFKISIKGTALGQIQQVGSLFFSRTTSLLISFLSAKAVVDGEITLSMMMSISYIIGQLSGPIGQVISFSQSLQDAKISLERLNEINNKEEEITDMDDKISVLPENRDIRMENVCFSYDGAERDYVLENLNLTIPHNKVTAIVGASGSGKTTVVKLLLGFYNPVKGDIKVGG